MKKIDDFLTDLSPLLRPEQIKTNPEDLAFYAQDWSRTLTPNSSAVLFPETTEETAQILKLASLHEIGVVPSGGRTGLSGGAVALHGEVVLSLTRMNSIGPLHAPSLSLKVQAGVITETVHEFLKPQGLTWPVDFASKGSSTIGGNIATNAGGVRVIRYGNTRNWVLGLTVVTMKGEVLELNHELEKNNTGYDFRQLLIGSEGTLAVITEATLKLSPLPRSTLVALFSLDGFSNLIRLFTECRRRFPTLSAFECLDSASMESVLEHFELPLPVSSPGRVYALLELENTEYTEVESALQEILESGLVLDGILAQNEKEARALWHYREGVAESILHGHEVHQEDVSVAVRDLEAFYAAIEARYRDALPGMNIYFFGHIGDGNLHIFIQKPDSMTKAEFQERAKESDFELFKILKSCHGSVSAEHGIGILKKHAIAFSRSPEELLIMGAVKKSFDPKGLLNPGKMID